MSFGGKVRNYPCNLTNLTEILTEVPNWVTEENYRYQIVHFDTLGTNWSKL